jgi:hypothetical protein
LKHKKDFKSKDQPSLSLSTLFPFSLSLFHSLAIYISSPFYFTTKKNICALREREREPDLERERELLMVDSSSSTRKTTKMTTSTSPCLSGNEKKHWWLSNRKVMVKILTLDQEDLCLTL